MKRNIVLIDVGTGNLRSVRKALESVGASIVLTSKPEVVIQGDPVVLPGVGAFGDFMRRLRACSLDQAVDEVWQRGIPILGICVGMQALFDISLEMGAHAGLGYLAGSVVQFSATSGLKVPHTGWNQLEFSHVYNLLAGLEFGSYAYFNHSYYCQAAEESHILAITQYGVRFASAVQRDNLYGVQFHPEKSQRVGQQILLNFIHGT